MNPICVGFYLKRFALFINRQPETVNFSYDSYGNLTKTPDAEYSYDLHNRLCEIRKNDGTGVKYSYDPRG